MAYFADIDECENNACVNGACVDGINSYTCACAAGWMGEYCSISEYLSLFVCLLGGLLSIDECIYLRENCHEYADIH